MLPGSQEERKVKRQRLDEFQGLTAGRQLAVYGLDGSEISLPLEENMTLEDLRKSVEGKISLRLGGMLVLTAGGRALDDSKPLLEQVQGDVITYVVQQVACAMFICCLFLLAASGSYVRVLSEGLIVRGQPRLVQGKQQLRFCEKVTANA